MVKYSKIRNCNKQQNQKLSINYTSLTYYKNKIYQYFFFKCLGFFIWTSTSLARNFCLPEGLTKVKLVFSFFILMRIKVQMPENSFLNNYINKNAVIKTFCINMCLIILVFGAYWVDHYGGAFIFQIVMSWMIIIEVIICLIFLFLDRRTAISIFIALFASLLAVVTLVTTFILLKKIKS